MDLKKLKEIFELNKQPDFRYNQVVDFYFKNPVTSWDEVSVVSKELRLILNKEVSFSCVELKNSYETDDVIKCVFIMKDGGHMVESVIMKHSDDRRTLCLSCQAGCPMGCYFCATGTMGLKKNLSASEIVDMAREAQIELSKRGEFLTNVVYMGMGEPLANYQAVKESLQILHDQFGLGWRRLSVSTCGIVPKIMEFAKDFPQVNLAISLHAPTDEKRSKMMPINDRFEIEKLMKVSEEYAKATNRKIFFEYLVIDGFNDTKEDAIEINKLFKNHLYHLNLIRFHATSAVKESYGVTWKAPTRKRMDDFLAELDKLGISYTLRRSFGERIDAACGMLALAEQKSII